MCGIAGLVSRKRDTRDAIEQMNRIQAHRGPNSQGVYCTHGLALGHTRLSILDLSDAGAQPYEFEHLVLVYNGEIYNFRDISALLTECGYTFESQCDTEVLIKAWHCWGEASLHKFNGMFSFAMFDQRTQKLFIARDSYGVKQAFYYLGDKELIFASELKTITKVIGTTPPLDHAAIATFLALHFVPAPATGWQGISKLAPGHILELDVSGSEPRVCSLQHWGDSYESEKCDPPTDLAAVDNALKQATSNQMISDVPLGAFLSGGVDSSLICYYASQVSTQPLHTFSVGFSDSGVDHDETPYAQRVASLINSIHHPVQVEIAEINDRVFSVLDSLGELNADTSVFLTDIVCEAAARHVTVCLSGAGGDELFAGYYRHQAILASGILDYFPAGSLRMVDRLLKQFPQHRDTSSGDFIRRLQQFLRQKGEHANSLSMLRKDHLFPQQSAFLANTNPVGFDASLTFDFQHYLADNILGFTDKMSMRHSLEVRVPFLDPGVLRAAECLSRRSKATMLNKKILLKRLAARYIPKDIIYRKKMGFSAPIDVWLRRYSTQALQDMCMDGVAVDILSEETIADLTIRFSEKRQDYSTQLYSLVVLNRWAANAC